MAGAFSGLLAYLISKMDGVGGLEGWRWIFILEGLLTVVVAVIAYFLVWDEPSSATFLSDREKAVIIDLLADSRASAGTNQLGEKSAFDWKQVTAAVLDWQAVAVYALSLFLPTIIKGLGYSSAIAQLLTIPVYAAASISCIAVGYFSDRLAQRCIFTLGCYLTVFIGFLIAVAPSSFIPGLTYAGCFIAACGIYPGIPGILALASNNFAPATKRAVGMAIQMGLGTLGGAAASNFYRDEDSPRYRLGHGLVLGFAALGLLVLTIYYFACRKINAKRDRESSRDHAEGMFDLGDKSPAFRYNL
ncbi:transporter [Aspergillus sclerotialis]|uniref:Transporter n=1 Tax=Aspergillus sclerotialis TaxID=2070753 RepID=A0A3A2ZNL3_9EURO|nr:transporter [Aspergillus sclerotialis]